MNSEISMCSYSSNLIATVVKLLIKSHMPCRAKTVNVSVHARNILEKKSQWPESAFFTKYDLISPVLLQFFPHYEISNMFSIEFFFHYSYCKGIDAVTDSNRKVYLEKSIVRAKVWNSSSFVTAVWLLKWTKTFQNNDIPKADQKKTDKSFQGIFSLQS